MRHTIGFQHCEQKWRVSCNKACWTYRKEQQQRSNRRLYFTKAFYALQRVDLICGSHCDNRHVSW